MKALLLAGAVLAATSTGAFAQDACQAFTDRAADQVKQVFATHQHPFAATVGSMIKDDYQAWNQHRVSHWDWAPCGDHAAAFALTPQETELQKAYELAASGNVPHWDVDAISAHAAVPDLYRNDEQRAYNTVVSLWPQLNEYGRQEAIFRALEQGTYGQHYYAMELSVEHSIAQAAAAKQATHSEPFHY